MDKCRSCVTQLQEQSGVVSENTYSRTAVKSHLHTDHLSWMHTSVLMYLIISNNRYAYLCIGIYVCSVKSRPRAGELHWWSCAQYMFLTMPLSTASTKMHMHQPVTKQQVLILRTSKIIADWKICFSWFQKILFILRNKTFFHLHTLSFLAILIFFFLFCSPTCKSAWSVRVEFRLNIIFSFPQWA